MFKTFLALVALLCLTAVVWALPTAIDAPRYSTDANGYFVGDLTGGNSQYIYIRVTMAGAKFRLDNGDWVVGDTLAGDIWFCWPQNVYQSADITNRTGQFPPVYINTTIAPYSTGTDNDCPIAWNQGGVALDFVLAVSSAGGWNYEHRGETNRGWAAGITSNDYFKNGFQVRAIFCRFGDGANTLNYNDAGWAQFNGTRDLEWTTPPYTPVANEPRLQDCDIVYTTALLNGLSVNATEGWNYEAGVQPFPWGEATTSRFNPDMATLDTDAPRTANAKGLGIPPDQRMTIAMQLLSPYKTTASHAALLGHQQFIKLRLWGTASDAAD